MSLKPTIKPLLASAIKLNNKITEQEKKSEKNTLPISVIQQRAKS